MTTQISSTIKGLTREFDLIAHNLANVSTPGFKRRYNDFSKSLLAQESITQNFWSVCLRWLKRFLMQNAMGLRKQQ